MSHRRRQSPAARTSKAARASRAARSDCSSSVVIGVSSTAPGYSIAATLGCVVAAVAFQAPAVMVLAFIPMLFIAYAYRELNRVAPGLRHDVHVGHQGLRPVGRMDGRLGHHRCRRRRDGLAVADRRHLRLPAVRARRPRQQHRGRHARGLHLDRAADLRLLPRHRGLGEVPVRHARGRGRHPRAVRRGRAREGVTPATAGPDAVTPSLSWFNPLNIVGEDGTFSFATMSSAVLLAVFIYWGWDSAVAVNEETKDPATTPGKRCRPVDRHPRAHLRDRRGGRRRVRRRRAARRLRTTSSPCWAPRCSATRLREGAHHRGAHLGGGVDADDDPADRAHHALDGGVPGPAARRSPRCTRGTSRRPRRRSPWASISIVFYVTMAAISDNILADSALAVGLLIAFYYGLTGFASAWYFRNERGSGFRDLNARIIMPLLGGLMLLGAFIITLQRQRQSGEQRDADQHVRLADGRRVRHLGRRAAARRDAHDDHEVCARRRSSPATCSTATP